jgi:hypothetical protein
LGDAGRAAAAQVAFDLYIVLKAISTVIERKGAY